MVAFNFKARFVAPILAGTKVQTIRAPRKRDPRVGETLQLQRGDRFHPVRIGTATAVLVDVVHLSFEPGRHARVIEGHMGPDVATALEDLNRFAVMDGFESWPAMAAFWLATHGVLSFHGVRTFWGETFVPAP